MSAEDWSETEYVSSFLQLSNWEEKIGNLSKAQLLLIAEYLNIEVVEGTKNGALLLKVVETVKVSKGKLDESNIQDESVLLDKQLQLQEMEMEKMKLHMKERELERVRERDKKSKERKKKNKKR